MHQPLALDQVYIRFADGTIALHGLSLDFPNGSFTAIVGPSGCGKSTTLRALSGLLAPAAGRATRPTRHQPGLVLPDPTLLAWTSA